ncbi:hypothetical protein EN784_01395 [bacterium M00.F.Ca.ET.141.01.1.1]|nr:hypothetical protein EOA35_25750 [Mesorhizobium sp. M8A.F.Ca.ET.023.01.1.1]RWC77729.1 MAG: hypothetical protein EOS71_00340 [Mesorhizobium sp.]TGV61082.1 hypothetical protein EN784_01395 [bacterium M00.F.Ca.ET.141.01.1.1]TIS89215.1 MAG: hypothetical protein E5W88_22575 [Mesorhizobium sp.]
MTKAFRPPVDVKRLRASQAAIRVTLRALKEAGLPVDKVCVIGGQVEIHCGHLDGGTAVEKDEGLQQW